MIIHILLLTLLLICYNITASAEENNPESLRLDLSRVNLYLESNQPDKAMALLQELKTRYPDNPDILAAEASAYLHTGNRGKSLALLNHLSELSPGNGAIRRMRTEAISVATPFAALEQNTINTGDNITEYVTRFTGSMRYSPQLAIGTSIEYNNIDADNVTQFDGTTGPVDTDNSRGEIYGTYGFNNGNQSTLSLYLAEGIIGGGASYSYIDTRGATTLKLALQRPDWEFIEEAIDRGRRDTVMLSRSHLFSPRLNLVVNASLNRYGLNDEYDIATSRAFNGGLSYLLPRMPGWDMTKHHAGIRFDYGLDSEYPFHVEKRTNIAGASYEPLPLNSREVHSLNATFTQALTPSFSYEISGGYAYDRLGGDGPLLSALLTWKPIDRLLLEAIASRSIRTETTSESVENIGIKAKWMF